MADVLQWLDERDGQKPMRLLEQLASDAGQEARQIRSRPPPPIEDRPVLRTVLRAAMDAERSAHAAIAQLEAVRSLDSRNVGSTYMSAAALLAAYRFPEVQATETRIDLSAEARLDCQGGSANTLYIVAGSEDQELLAPIVVALLSEVMALGARRASRDGPFLPTVRVVGDELANIAPIRSLPRYLSTLRSPGFRFAIVAQNLSQLRAVYGPEETDTILTNCQAKLFLGPVTCTQTLDCLTKVLGDTPTISQTRRPSPPPGEPAALEEHNTWRPQANARELQQLGDRRALLLHTTLPAAVVRTVPWWDVPTLHSPK